ncbi:hypothetical protein N7462_003108 [Penicillium macrosclerotiorum]|uniref:uncharacterized protein n=1 Tax=Penicillium macrosclerotiorum TaxID=303699 RepID=UPI0025497AC2|nr:uncharacterized protein N7462_003108 [Penicillium macrosclerotiorum]KAJ5688716.1 hypothetical protein N7462_003108 [Penicillium macrosclerotiorum]
MKLGQQHSNEMGPLLKAPVLTAGEALRREWTQWRRGLRGCWVLGPRYPPHHPEYQWAGSEGPSAMEPSYAPARPLAHIVS